MDTPPPLCRSRDEKGSKLFRHRCVIRYLPAKKQQKTKAPNLSVSVAKRKKINKPTQ